jgi:2'-5' RNA ligase
MSEQKTRAFIAVEFPDNVIKEIARVQELIKTQKFHGKLTELENLHLTLKFLGEIDSGKLEKIKKHLADIKFAELGLKLGGIGTFNFKGSPRIIWIKIEGKQIFELQEKIDAALKDYFSSEERFMSHLTIARVKYVKDKKSFLNYIKNISIKDIKFKIDNFKLKKSDLRPIGPVYSDIESYKTAA